MEARKKAAELSLTPAPQRSHKPKLEPLQITCTSTDCDNGLHCFRQTQKLGALNRAGACRECGAVLVDWPRVHQRAIGDADNTIQSLHYEMIRHHFWHTPIDERAKNHAHRKGRAQLREDAVRRIMKSVGAAIPSFDGRQTPRSGNILYYAQHATATCCRKCIEEWHGIPLGQELSAEEVSYLATLINRYVEERMPELSEDGVKVPARRTTAGKGGKRLDLPN